ncbi:exonuclease SbcCD subunit D [Yimella radicis]
MRLLHTSDWHLGRSFHGVGLLDAQRAYLQHLVEVVRSERVDALLVSGDIYDRALPSPDTVAVLDDALVALSEAGTSVILSSGNHDSARRLGFGARLLSRVGLHIVTDLSQIGSPIVVGDTAIHALPYLEPAVAAEALGATERTHAGVMRAALSRVREHPGAARTVVMAHSFVAGATTSDSERDVSVGGLGVVPVEVFDDIDYVALGHLHRPQVLRDNVRYSGSPMPFSFSEAGHPKSSTLVDLDAGTYEQIPTPVFRGLARLRGELEELLDDPSLDHAQDAWCEVTLTDALQPVAAMERIRGRFPHTLSLHFDGPVRADSGQSYVQRLHAKADVEVCCDFVEHVRSTPVDEAEQALLQEGLGAIRVARAGKDDEGVADRRAGVA